MTSTFLKFPIQCKLALSGLEGSFWPESKESFMRGDRDRAFLRYQTSHKISVMYTLKALLVFLCNILSLKRLALETSNTVNFKDLGKF